MVRIRLKRMGKKKHPFYRIVVQDSRVARDAKALAEIGYYNPASEPIELKVDTEEAEKWLGHGAQPSDTVRGLFKEAGIIK